MKWEVRIEKGIPAPLRKWEEILKRMEVGDSFLLPTSNPGGTRTAIYACGKKLGMKMRSAKWNEGIRFWRIK